MALDNLIKEIEYEISKLETKKELLKEIQESLYNIHYLAYRFPDEHKKLSNFFRDEFLEINLQIKSKKYILRDLLKKQSSN